MSLASKSSARGSTPPSPSEVVEDDHVERPPLGLGLLGQGRSRGQPRTGHDPRQGQRRRPHRKPGREPRRAPSLEPLHHIEHRTSARRLIGIVEDPDDRSIGGRLQHHDVAASRVEPAHHSAVAGRGRLHRSRPLLGQEEHGHQTGGQRGAAPGPGGAGAGGLGLPPGVQGRQAQGRSAPRARGWAPLRERRAARRTRPGGRPARGAARGSGAGGARNASAPGATAHRRGRRPAAPGPALRGSASSSRSVLVGSRGPQAASGLPTSTTPTLHQQLPHPLAA